MKRNFLRPLVGTLLVVTACQAAQGDMSTTPFAAVPSISVPSSTATPTLEPTWLEVTAEPGIPMFSDHSFDSEFRFYLRQGDLAQMLDVRRDADMTWVQVWGRSNTGWIFTHDSQGKSLLRLGDVVTKLIAESKITPSTNVSPAIKWPTSTVPAQCEPTDQDLYVYSPSRLLTISPCVRVVGMIKGDENVENDGDFTFNVDLDPPYRMYLSPASITKKSGYIHVEIVCYDAQKATVTIAALCAKNPNPLRSVPPVGQRVWLEGRMVLDAGHASWTELHPLYRWGLAQGN